MFGSAEKIKRRAAEHNGFAEHLGHLKERYPELELSPDLYMAAVEQIFLICKKRPANAESIRAIQNHKFNVLLLMNQAGISQSSPFPLLARKSLDVQDEIQRSVVRAYLYIANESNQEMIRLKGLDDKWHSRPDMMERFRNIQLFLNGIDDQHLTVRRLKDLNRIQGDLDNLTIDATSRLMTDFENAASPEQDQKTIERLKDLLFMVEQISPDYAEHYQERLDNAVKRNAPTMAAPHV